MAAYANFSDFYNRVHYVQNLEENTILLFFLAHVHSVAYYF